MLHILNLCCGAVGAYFSGRLAQDGADVAVTLRSDYDAVKSRGFSIESINGDFVFRPSAVLHDASEYPGTADYVFYTAKVLPEADAVKILRPAVRQGSVIVLIQNGLDVDSAIRQAFPANEVLSAVAYIGVTRTAPGHVVHSAKGILYIGKTGGGIMAAAQRLCAAFTHAGVRAEAVEDILTWRWRKLLWNTVFNPVSVLGGGLFTNEMVDDSPVTQLCTEAMQEVLAVALRDGAELAPEDVAGNIEYTRNFVPYKTSMLIDVENHRPMEVDAILGQVVRRAHALGVPVPKLETLYALLDAVDRKTRQERK